MIKKIIFFMLILFILTGCTSNKGVEEITFSSWGSLTEVEVIKNIILDFERENPDIKIKFMHFPQNYFQKIHLLFASNTSPDVIFINNIYLPLYKGKLEDLSELVENEKYYEQALDAMKIDSKLYAIPRDVSNLVLYINTDILNANSIPNPTEDWTLDKMIEIAASITDDSVYGIGYEPILLFAMPYINYFDGDINTKDIEQIEGLNFYRELPREVAPKRSDVGSSTIAQMFIDGKIAFYLSGRWMYPKINEKADFNWIVMTFPYGKKGVSCDASGWAISKNSKHKEASKRFINYISSETSAKYFAQTGLVVPARIEASKLLDNNKYNEKAFLKAITHSTKNPVDKNYKKIADKIEKTLEY
ncbi:MAG: sugar ABC transporter substrate-binding protein [bacterium]|nr:sugar ABC transporter substrate-binding protein [bacterium]